METINVITTILTVAFGAGWGVHFLYYRYEKRRKQAETINAELDVDAKEDALSKTRLTNAYETIVKLQGIVDTERERWIAVSVELSEVKEILYKEKEARKAAEREKCTVLDCENRMPPRVKTK